MTGIFLFIALVAVLAAVYFFAAHRTARATLAGKEAALRKLQEQVEGASKEAATSRAEARERREEAVQLRDQLKEAKKRAFEQADALKKTAGAAALREEIEKLGTRLADARAEGAAAAERAKALEAQATAAQRELERARASAAEAVAQARAQAAPPPAPPAAPAAPAAAGADLDLLRTEKDRADKAEAKLAEVRKKAAELDRDLKAARGRLETDRRVYMVQKGELDIAHDRYAELRRRYDALRKEHEELIDAVRQAAREEKRAQEGAAAPPPAPPAGDQG
jgi:colicin import membrane protein